MPQVSVIIPVYNTEEYLEDCLRSVQNQTFADFEAIVINDGSTDGSEEIINKFVKNDSRFTLINQDNGGPSAARNTGLKVSQAPWITFVDSDDIIVPSFLERMYNLANGTVGCCSKKIVDMVCCGSAKFRGNTIPTASTTKKEIKLWSPEDAIAQALYQDRVPDYSAWNKLYSRSLWENETFPVGKYFEDLAIIPHIMQKAKLIVSTEAILYLYRIHGKSILRTAYNSQKAELLNIAENLYQTIFQSGQTKNSKLVRAAQNTLISASFSILMRTPKDEFGELHVRALAHIKALRKDNIFNPNVRLRNKMAAILSYLPQKYFLKFLERGIS